MARYRRARASRWIETPNLDRLHAASTFALSDFLVEPYVFPDTIAALMSWQATR